MFLRRRPPKRPEKSGSGRCPYCGGYGPGWGNYPGYNDPDYDYGWGSCPGYGPRPRPGCGWGPGWGWGPNWDCDDDNGNNK